MSKIDEFFLLEVVNKIVTIKEKGGFRMSKMFGSTDLIKDDQDNYYAVVGEEDKRIHIMQLYSLEKAKEMNLLDNFIKAEKHELEEYRDDCSLRVFPIDIVLQRYSVWK